MYKDLIKDALRYLQYKSVEMSQGCITFPLDKSRYIALPVVPLRGGYGTLEFSLSDTESPIEAMLHYELSTVLLQKFQPDEVNVCGRVMMSGLPYRIDLTILGFDRKKRCITPLAIIECDGKEYHSTDEQKKRDKQRETQIRDFFQNTPFFRFTGAQINADAGECAFEVLKAIFKPLMDLKMSLETP